MHIIYEYNCVDCLWMIIHLLGLCCQDFFTKEGGWPEMRMHVVSKLTSQVTASGAFSKCLQIFLGRDWKKWYHCLISQSQTHQWLPIAYKKIPEFCHWVDKVLDAEASRHTHYLLPSSAPNNTHYWWVPQHPGYFSYCFCPCYFLFGECLTSNGYLANPHRSWKPFVIIPLRGGIPMCQLPWEPLPPCWVVLWVIWWLRGSDIRKTWVWTLPLPLTSRSPLGTSLNFSFLIYTIPTSQRDHKN